MLLPNHTHQQTWKPKCRASSRWWISSRKSETGLLGSCMEHPWNALGSDRDCLKRTEVVWSLSWLFWFRGSQWQDAGTPRRSAGRHERREQWEHPRVDINVVDSCREDGRNDRRSDNDAFIKESRIRSQYGLRGARVGERSHPGPRLLRRYPGGRARRVLIPCGRNVVLRLSGVDSSPNAQGKKFRRAGSCGQPWPKQDLPLFHPRHVRSFRWSISLRFPAQSQLLACKEQFFRQGSQSWTQVQMTGQEELGGEMRGNRFAALSDTGDEGQFPVTEVKPQLDRVCLGLTTQGLNARQRPRVGSRPQRASRGCQMWKFTMLWNPQLSQTHSHGSSASARKRFLGFGRSQFNWTLQTSAIRVALQEIVTGEEAQSDWRVTRGRKKNRHLPRFRPPRGGKVPRRQLEARITMFQDGQWLQLLDESSNCAEKAHQNNIREKRRRDDDDGEAKRAAGALSVVRVGGLSAARQALEGVALEPGSSSTLAAFTDPERRPPPQTGVGPRGCPHPTNSAVRVGRI